MNPVDSSPSFFEGAFSIGDTDILALPVKHLGPAVAFYVCVLGFSVSEQSEKTATLKRDNAVIGLAENGRDPEQASVYFSVRHLESLRSELVKKYISPSDVGPGDHDGKKYRIFFAREPFGVCFCFGQQV